MAIARADVLTDANNITRRNETDSNLTRYLRNVVHKIEKRGLFIEAEESITLTAGDETYAVPANYRRPLNLQPIDTNGSQHWPLREIPYWQYRLRLVWRTGQSRPLEYAIHNDVINIWPKPNSTYPTLRIWGFKEHGDDVSTILYADKYQNMITNGVAFEIFRRFGLAVDPKAQETKAEFQDELDEFIKRINTRRNHIVQYNDI